MHMKRTAYSKKAVSSILGTLIFIGILFSAVVPMMLVMKQADVILEQKKLEVQRLDEERIREDLALYAYPNGLSSITVKVHNRCEVPIIIRRIWINDEEQDIDCLVSPVEVKEIGSYSITFIPDQINTYRVRITTARGNVYESLSGIIAHDGSEWVQEEIGINVVIDSGSGGFLGFGKYRATVANATYSETKETDFASGSASLYFLMMNEGTPLYGEYTVTVEKRLGNFWTGYYWEVMATEEVVLEIDGPPVVWVYV